MNIGTKLIFLLTFSTGAVMLLGSFLFLQQREAALEQTLVGELRAHAITLRITLEENYGRGRIDESQKLIDRLRDNTRVYAVLLFDEHGEVLKVSQSGTDPVFQKLPEVARVIETGVPARSFRYVNGEKYLSVLKPVQFAPGRRGVLELVKPLKVIEREIFDARMNWLVITVFLIAVILLVVTVVLRQNLTRPLEELLKGAEILGEGNLDYRVRTNKGGDELNLLAAGFNRMAENLAAQKRAVTQEAENRLGLERELRHSERLAAVGRLAAGLAHELGAPLNVIDARAAQILEKEPNASEKTKNNLGIIRRQTDRISHLVRQLLNLARPFNFNLKPVHLNGHLHETIEQEAAEEENIKIETDEKADLNVYADADFLRQVWVNILKNARQALADTGGVIRIGISEARREDQDFAVVRFTDSGRGIAPEDLERVFDPFYTTKDIGQGTGLGLAVAHRIIEEHGGLITAENAEGGGAVFTVCLPLAGE